MDILDPLKKALLAGLGAQEKLKELVDELVKKGELSENQATKLVNEWSHKAEKGTADISKTLSEVVSKTLEKMNIPTKEELEALKKEIKALKKEIKEMKS